MAGEKPRAVAPPAGVAPGVLGTVVFGRARYEQVTATMLDFASRGHLRIARLPDPSGADDTTWWQLQFTRGRDELRRCEQVLLDELGVRTGPERFPNLTNRSAGKVAGALEDEAAERGWLVDNPTRRLRATLAAVLLTSRRRSLHRTEGGTELAERGEAFQSALYTHHREVDAEWYPHAVALGRSVEFARTLDARGDPTPQWLVDEQEPPLTWANVSDLALKGSPYGPGAADGAM